MMWWIVLSAVLCLWDAAALGQQCTLEACQPQSEAFLKRVEQNCDSRER